MTDTAKNKDTGHGVEDLESDVKESDTIEHDDDGSNLQSDGGGGGAGGGYDCLSFFEDQMAQLHEMKREGVLCDLAINCRDDSAVYCHRNILKTRSNLENLENLDHINMLDQSADTVNAVVDFLYTAWIPLSLDNVRSIHDVVKRLEISTLQDRIDQFLHDNLGRLPDAVLDSLDRDSVNRVLRAVEGEPYEFFHKIMFRWSRMNWSVRQSAYWEMVEKLNNCEDFAPVSIFDLSYANGSAFSGNLQASAARAVKREESSETSHASGGDKGAIAGSINYGHGDYSFMRGRQRQRLIYITRFWRLYEFDGVRVRLCDEFGSKLHDVNLVLNKQNESYVGVDVNPAQHHGSSVSINSGPTTANGGSSGGGLVHVYRNGKHRYTHSKRAWGICETVTPQLIWFDDGTLCALADRDEPFVELNSAQQKLFLTGSPIWQKNPTFNVVSEIVPIGGDNRMLLLRPYTRHYYGFFARLDSPFLSQAANSTSNDSLSSSSSLVYSQWNTCGGQLVHAYPATTPAYGSGTPTAQSLASNSAGYGLYHGVYITSSDKAEIRVIDREQKGRAQLPFKPAINAKDYRIIASCSFGSVVVVVRKEGFQKYQFHRLDLSGGSGRREAIDSDVGQLAAGHAIPISDAMFIV